MQARSPNENQVVAHFRVHSIPNEAASKKAGRPIYDDIEVCDLRFPANRKTVGTFPANEIFKYDIGPSGMNESITYAMAYSEQYKQFKAGVAQTMSGTPIEELPFLTQGKRLELKALNIYTAEQLAGLDGQPLKQLGMSGRDLKDQAQAYLNAASGSADVTRLASENAQLRDMLAQMQVQIDKLSAGGPTSTVPAPEGSAGDDDDAPAGGTTADDAEKQFADWPDADIKEWIKEETGQAPRGNPNHETLVRMAAEVYAEKEGQAS